MKKSNLLKTIAFTFASLQMTAAAMAQSWNLNGNALTPATSYLGTSDTKDLYLGTGNVKRLKLVGIAGTNTGILKLQGANTYFTFGGTGSGNLTWPANNALNFATLTNTDDISTATSRMVITGDGKVGIGTAAPAANLEVVADNGLVRLASLSTGMNIGMAVSNCNGCYGVENNSAIINAQRNSKFYLNAGGVYNAARADLVFSSGFGNPLNYMTIFGATGNVGIGTNCVPVDGKLAVNGKIYATALQLKLTDANGCFPDYVFAPNYKLPSLEEVEKYIKENNHLAGIPSALEIEKNGVDMMSFNTKMLEKIEELTLYIIELKKENAAIKMSLDTLNK